MPKKSTNKINVFEISNTLGLRHVLEDMLIEFVRGKAASIVIDEAEKEIAYRYEEEKLKDKT